MNFVKTYSIVSFLLFFSTFLSAQKISMEFMFGTSKPKFVYNWHSPIQENWTYTNQKMNFSIGMSGQLYKWVYLKMETGSNSIEKVVNIAFEETNPNAPGKYQYYGRYFSEQIYMAILPEIRLCKGEIIYFNIGPGLYHSINSGYSFLWISRKGSSEIYENISANTESMAFIANIGINPKWKKMGLIFNIGYNYVKPPVYTLANPGVGFKQFNYRAGLSFLLSE